MDRIANTVALIIGLATVTTIVSRTESAQVMRAFGDALTGSIRAAMRD